MSKNLAIILFLLMLTGGTFFSGCTPAPQQVTTPANQEGPEPDLSAIKTALEDASPLVRKQAVENLKQYNHSSIIPLLIDTIKKNENEGSVVSAASDALVKYKEAAIAPVRESLWTDPNIKLQGAAFNILSQVDKKETFYPEAQQRFDSTPNVKENEPLRQAIARYIIQNASKDTPTGITDVVVMLGDSDTAIGNQAMTKLIDWKNPAAIETMNNLYFNKYTEPTVVRSILGAMMAYDVPAENKSATALTDISVFLETFGSYDKLTQQKSYEGLKKFGYNDPEGKIVGFLKRFENCDDEIVRSNVLDLLQSLPAKQYPQNVTPPTFKIPINTKKEGSCSI